MTFYIPLEKRNRSTNNNNNNDIEEQLDLVQIAQQTGGSTDKKGRVSLNHLLNFSFPQRQRPQPIIRRQKITSYQLYIYKIDMHKAVNFIKNNKNKYVFSFFSFGNNDKKVISNEFKKYNVKKQNPLELPEIVENNIEKVKEYLICKRYINRNIVNSLIKEKRIYSDNYNNCIFTNESYTFCSIRGTSTNKYVSCRGVPDYIVYKRNIKMDLYLFESPIDTLSYMTLNPDKDGVFISTNGSMMINNFLKYEIQTYSNLYLCLDNDKQGNIYYNNIMQAFKKYKINIIRIKSNYKDFNEDLINLIDFKK